MTVNINKYIVANSDICHGQLTFKGTRIMVYLILEMLAAGESVDAILEDYPALSQNHVRAALVYAAKVAESGRLAVSAKK
jgi:uncharacterized protein (DUF433 family)